MLLQDDTVLQGLWSLGRIENTYPGGDCIVPVANVQTKTGVYRRPVTKIDLVEEQTFDEVSQRGGNVTESNSENGR